MIMVDYDLMEVDSLTDDYGMVLEVGTVVVADGGSITGDITACYNNNSVDIHHSDSHQGPVIDSFDVIHNEVRVFDVP